MISPEVVKVRIYIIASSRSTYREFRPANALAEVSKLIDDALIAIEADVWTRSEEYLCDGEGRRYTCTDPLST